MEGHPVVAPSINVSHMTQQLYYQHNLSHYKNHPHNRPDA